MAAKRDASGSPVKLLRQLGERRFKIRQQSVFLGRKSFGGGNRIGIANFFVVRPFQQLVCRVDLSLGNGFLKLLGEITGFHLPQHKPRDNRANNQNGGTAGDNNAPMDCGSPGNLGFEQRGTLAKTGRGFLWNWPGEIRQRTPDFVQCLVIIAQFRQFDVTCRCVLFLRSDECDDATRRARTEIGALFCPSPVRLAPKISSVSSCFNAAAGNCNLNSSCSR